MVCVSCAMMGTDMFVSAMTTEDCMCGRRALRPSTFSMRSVKEKRTVGLTSRYIIVARALCHLHTVFICARAIRDVPLANSASVHVVEVAYADLLDQRVYDFVHGIT